MFDHIISTIYLSNLFAKHLSNLFVKHVRNKHFRKHYRKNFSITKQIRYRKRFFYNRVFNQIDKFFFLQTKIIDCIHVHHFIDIIFLYSNNSWIWFICDILKFENRCFRFRHWNFHDRHEYIHSQLIANDFSKWIENFKSITIDVQFKSNFSNFCRNFSRNENWFYFL